MFAFGERLNKMESNKMVMVIACAIVIGAIGVCEAGGKFHKGGRGLGDDFHKGGGGLHDNFYKDTCPDAEQIVKDIIDKRMLERPNLNAKLLRLHFHDCVVRGCEGSVLLNSTSENTAEKDAIPNLSLEGFDVIEEIKAEMEAQCPGVVSCADILALAARDAVSFSFDKPLWRVLTGRRDGTVSSKEEALDNVPSPFFNFAQLQQLFASKRLTVHDLVVLSGAHTIGRAHCNLFSKRLFNFSGNGDQDPSLDSSYADFLKTQCKGLNDFTTTVEMDPSDSNTFDNNYYSNLLQNEGLFTPDAALLTDHMARTIVNEMVKDNHFFGEFAKSMQKLGALDVLTGEDGQIRTVCARVNP